MASVRHLQQLGNAQDTGGSQFNPAVFWSVNALWITLVIGLAIWIWKFHGLLRLGNWTQSFVSQDSEQQDVESEQQAVPPEKRRKLLSDYFRNSKVHMVSDSCFFYSFSLFLNLAGFGKQHKIIHVRSYSAGTLYLGLGSRDYLIYMTHDSTCTYCSQISMSNILF